MSSGETLTRLSDFELTSQLYAFMQSIPALWDRSQVKEMFEKGEVHTETRGPSDRFIQFEFNVLESGLKFGEQYLHLVVLVADPGRKKGQAGSSYEPLCSSFLWFATGELDMPSAREIFEGAFERRE